MSKAFSPEYQPSRLTKGHPLAELVSKILIEDYGWDDVRGWAQKDGLQFATCTNSAHGHFMGVWRKKDLELHWRRSLSSLGDPARIAAEVAAQCSQWATTQQAA